MLESLPKLSDGCKDFVSKAQKIGERRQLNTMCLEYHSELLEVLELPQLMETCVRNGFYEEALESMKKNNNNNGCNTIIHFEQI